MNQCPNCGYYFGHAEGCLEKSSAVPTSLPAMPNRMNSQSQTPLTDALDEELEVYVVNNLKTKPLSEIVGYVGNRYVDEMAKLELKLREAASLIERRSAHLVEGGKIMDEFIKEHENLRSQLTELLTIANELAKPIPSVDVSGDASFVFKCGSSGWFHYMDERNKALAKLSTFNHESPE